MSPQELAPIFSSLGDPTRLQLVSRLLAGKALSISRLAEGNDISRQAISKHLAVLQKSGVVQSQRNGRENLFALQSESITAAQDYLNQVAAQWDDALMRLQTFLEDPSDPIEP